MKNIQLHLIQFIRSLPWLHKLTWRCRKAYWRVHRKLLFDKPLIDLSPVLSAAIIDSRPFAAGKMGSLELEASKVYIGREKARKNKSTVPAYSPYLLDSLHVVAGVFPKDPEAYDRFCKIFLKATQSCDGLAAWDVAGEALVMSSYCPQISIFRRKDLEPYRHPKPWTSALAGKNVLVISPFTGTIQKQFERRTELWANQETLPDFNLITLRAPLSAGIVPSAHHDWFAALDEMKAKMDSLNYDVVLVGAGAFSLPLTVHAKLRGKIGVHLGGCLQLLFGIMGNRWEHDKEISPYVNPSWTRPGGEEKPTNIGKVENACYW